MKPFKIEQKFNFPNGINLEYIWSGGVPAKGMKVEDLKNIVTNILKDRKKAPTMIEMTSIIKSAYKELEERHLDIAIIKENEYIETVNYLNKKLNIYYYHKEPTEKEDIDIEIEYSSKHGYNFYVDKNRKTSMTISKIKIQRAIMNKNLKELEQLLCIEIPELLFEEKLVCEVYRLFYKENPNFSRNKDKIKAQSMLAFLIEFGISVPAEYDRNDFYSFTLTNNHNMVTSLDLSQTLNRLAPLGEIKEDFRDVVLATEAKQTIEIVGQEICEHMNKQENPVEWFKDLVRINYIKNRRLTSASTAKEIAQESQCQENTVKSNLTLVRKITDRVYQN